VGKGIFITGTDTDVGKTQVTAGLAAALHRWQITTRSDVDFRPITLWKPVQTGVQLGSVHADSYRLWKGSGLPVIEEEIASYTFPDPAAPWIAARRASETIVFEELVDEGRRRLEHPGLCLIEGAGGLLVPLTDCTTIADLAGSLGLPLLIVARAGLGTVNHTLLTVAYARQIGLPIAGVILNGYRKGQEASLQENKEMIERFGGVSVLGCLPWFAHDRWDDAGWADWREQWTSLVEQNVALEYLLNLGEPRGRS
jgi:dethiobiotin synthetase